MFPNKLKIYHNRP